MLFQCKAKFVKLSRKKKVVHFSCLGLKEKKSRPTDPFFSRHVTVNTPFFLALQ